MILKELSHKCFTTPRGRSPVTIYVFNDEDSADSWTDDNYNDCDSRDSLLLCTMRSNFESEYYMKDDIINSEVLYFYAVERDIIVAVIDYERVKK